MAKIRTCQITDVEEVLNIVNHALEDSSLLVHLERAKDHLFPRGPFAHKG